MDANFALGGSEILSGKFDFGGAGIDVERPHDDLRRQRLDGDLIDENVDISAGRYWTNAGEAQRVISCGRVERNHDVGEACGARWADRLKPSAVQTDLKRL